MRTLITPQTLNRAVKALVISKIILCLLLLADVALAQNQSQPQTAYAQEQQLYPIHFPHQTRGHAYSLAGELVVYASLPCKINHTDEVDALLDTGIRLAEFLGITFEGYDPHTGKAYLSGTHYGIAIRKGNSMQGFRVFGEITGSISGALFMFPYYGHDPSLVSFSFDSPTDTVAKQ